MLPHELLTTLVRLAPQTVTDIATALHQDRSNLTNMLAGRRALPSDLQAQLEQWLGLDENSRPMSDRIYWWSLTRRAGDFQDLIRAIPYYFPSGAEIVTILPRGMNPYSLRRTDTVWAVTDHRIRVCVRKTTLLDFPSLPGFSFEDDVPGLRIRGGGWKTGGLAYVADYPRWQERLATPGEFDDMWEGRVGRTWDEVIQAAQERGISPARVIELITALAPEGDSCGSDSEPR